MSFNLTWSRRWRLHETTSVQGCVYEMSRDAYEALWRERAVRQSKFKRRVDGVESWAFVSVDCRFWDVMF